MKNASAGQRPLVGLQGRLNFQIVAELPALCRAVEAAISSARRRRAEAANIR